MVSLPGRLTPPAEWALLQRQVLADMAAAARFYVDRYTRDDDTLIWRDAWPGMDGSDDGYENFGNFPLFYALGGAADIHEMSRREWDAVTRQFTAFPPGAEAVVSLTLSRDVHSPNCRGVGRPDPECE